MMWQPMLQFYAILPIIFDNYFLSIESISAG